MKESQWSVIVTDNAAGEPFVTVYGPYTRPYADDLFAKLAKICKPWVHYVTVEVVEMLDLPAEIVLEGWERDVYESTSDLLDGTAAGATAFIETRQGIRDAG